MQKNRKGRKYFSICSWIFFLELFLNALYVKMPASAVQLDNILPVEKSEKIEPNNHKTNHLILC